MTRTLHKLRREGDSTTAGDVPADVELPAGYVDGAYVTVPQLHKRFPHKRIVMITVNGSTPHADVIDQESGDATPRASVRYVVNERKQHGWPTIYFPLSDIAAVCKALAAVGLGPDVPLWTAHYTGKPHICGADCLKPYGPLPFKPLIVATQYATPGIGVSGHFDLSLVADYWPGVDPKPKPVKATPLAGTTRIALRLVARNLRGRNTPVATPDQPYLTAAQKQIQRVLNLKEKP